MAAREVIKVVFEGVDQTSKAVKNIQRGLGNTEKAIGNLQRSLGGMTGALAAAAGAAGFGLMAKNALATADSLAKTSRKLGTTADQLFKFQTQAELAGISTDTANMALQRFTRRTAEAAQGTGEAKNALIELGINAKEIQDLPLDQKMKVLADAFRGVQSPADRLRLAFKLFDSEGAAMVNMLEGGSESLEETERRMRELGLGVNNDAIPALEEFNDSMFLMQRAVQGAFIEGLGEAGPILDDLTRKLTPVIIQITQGLLRGLQWLLDNMQIVTNYIKAFAAVWAGIKLFSIATALYGVATALGAVGIAAAPVAVPLIAIGAAIAAATMGIDEFTANIKGIAQQFGFFQDEATGASDASDDLAAAMDKLGKPGGELMPIMEGAGEATGELEDALDNLQDTAKPIERKTLPDLADGVDDLADTEIGATARTNEFRVALEKLRTKALKPQRDLDEFTKKMKILQKQMEETEGPTEDLERQMAELVKEFTGVADEAQEIRDEIAATKAAIDLLTKSGKASEDQLSGLRDQLEELGGKLVEVTGKNTSLTAAQNALLTELNANKDAINDLNGELADLNALYNAGLIPAEAYRKKSLEIKGEIHKLRVEELGPLGRAISGAFDDSAIGEFLSTMEGLNSDPIFGELLGSFSGTKTAIDGCFSTTPVTDFGDAIKDLFTGDGSALGGFGGALTSLTTALGGFFTGAETKFGLFKTAIITILEEIAAAAIASVGINFLKNLIPGINTGGLVGEFAEGGRVFGRGGPKEDKVLARLSAGEYVINAASVSKFGTGFFDMLNDGKMAMPGFQQGGFVDFNPISIEGFIINKILGAIFGSIFGGESESRQMSKIRRGTRSYVAESFLEVLKQIDENYGFGRRLYRRTKPQRQGGIDKLYDVILPTIMNEILPPGADLDHHRKVAEGINEIGPGFAKHIYDFLVGRLLQIRFDTVDFNMDDVVKKLFDDANAVAGGSLFLQGRQFGGPLERGQASVVGENGPELFVPSRRGQVSPISRDGGRELVTAVREVKAEVAALRRQMDRQNPVQLKGGRN